MDGAFQNIDQKHRALALKLFSCSSHCRYVGRVAFTLSLGMISETKMCVGGVMLPVVKTIITFPWCASFTFYYIFSFQTISGSHQVKWRKVGHKYNAVGTLSHGRLVHPRLFYTKPHQYKLLDLSQTCSSSPLLSHFLSSHM